LAALDVRTPPHRARVFGTFGVARPLQMGPRMTKKIKKTLRLNPETLRVLKPGQLVTAAGGLRVRDSDCDTCAERGC
jgi:hypothetical protein